MRSACEPSGSPTGQPARDLAEDLLRHLLGPLRSRGADAHELGVELLAGVAPPAQPVRLGLEVAPHAPARHLGVARDHRVDDARVGVRAVRRGCLPDLRELAEVGVRHPGDDVDEQLERGIAGDRGELEVDATEVRRLAALLGRDQLAQPRRALLGEPPRRELRDGLLEHDPGFEDLVEADLREHEVDHHGVDDGRDRRRGDDDAAAGTAARPRDTGVLHQAHGLPEHRAADAVTLDQLALGAQHLPFGPAERDDVVDHPVRDARRGLGLHGTVRRRDQLVHASRSRRCAPGRSGPARSRTRSPQLCCSLM